MISSILKPKSPEEIYLGFKNYSPYTLCKKLDEYFYHENRDILLIIAEHETDPYVLNMMLEQCCKKYIKSIPETLFSRNIIDPSRHNNYLIRQCYYHNNLTFIKILLKYDSVTSKLNETQLSKLRLLADYYSILNDGESIEDFYL